MFTITKRFYYIYFQMNTSDFQNYEESGFSKALLVLFQALFSSMLKSLFMSIPCSVLKMIRVYKYSEKDFA